MDEITFPKHLYELVNTKNLSVTWDKSGTKFLINFDKLDVYLKSSVSKFSAANQEGFMFELFHWGFRRCNYEKLSEKESLKRNPRETYMHEYFRRNNPNLVDLMTPIQRVRKNPKIFVKHDYVQSVRDKDPCYKIFWKQPRMEREVNLMATVAAFEMTKQNLPRQMKRKKIINFSMGTMPWNEEAEQQSAGNEKSVSVGDIAGSYGIEDNEKLKEFFGSYVPTYALENSDALPSNSVPQVSTSKTRESPVNEDQEESMHNEAPMEIFADSSMESVVEEILPEDGQSPIHASALQTENFNLSLQLQECFDVLYNC